MDADPDDYADDVGGFVVAAYDFEAENDDELGVPEGTRLRTLERRDEWWFAETEDGARQGIIPVTYVVSEEEYSRLVEGSGSAYDVDEIDLADIPDVMHSGSGEAVGASKTEENGETAESIIEAQLGHGPEQGQDSASNAAEISPAEAPATAPVAPHNSSSSPPPPPPDQAEAAWKEMQASTTSAPVGGMATAPNPETAAQTPPAAKAEAPDLSYEDLASQFEDLQRRVASVRLSEPPVPGDETKADEAEHEGEGEGENSAPSMPPRVSVDVRKASTSSGAPAQQGNTAKPPSPQEAAAAASLQRQLEERARSQQHTPPHDEIQTPAPPSPVMARKMLDQEEASRQRRASAEEESANRAAQLRAERERVQLRQRAAAEEDRQGREHIRRMGQTPTSRAQEFKSSAVEAAKSAVAADQAKEFDKAYRYYIAALENFCNVLEVSPPRPGGRDSRGVICERMQGYLSRMSSLEPLLCKGVWSDGKNYGLPQTDRYPDRVRIILQMARTRLFNPGVYGDELRVKARFAETKDDYRGAFRAYSEGLEYYMACHKLLKESGKPDDPALVMHISNMLTAAERLKQRI
ncbi:Tyrosine-protein kinase Lck [Hondaea fermentalgiana]|uniref:Tyrosine-protein kinase Lck n=1 Tax=Hondaea fermentalgiana TaxID=2315210 RepID=A0A2R5GPU6_9STRA|nr:Tyrosine-protein kinase Lck [Hondaea fermentalgiana]|eukprot:GBG30643.1 Tyrosine-protein kinase Lck [Hondaea fermentalgiana]